MYEEYLEFAVGLARQAGAIQMESFRGGDLGVEAKSNLYDVVTRVDKACEALIARSITERYPDHALLGEEGGLRGRLDRRFLGVGSPRVGCSGR